MFTALHMVMSLLSSQQHVIPLFHASYSTVLSFHVVPSHTEDTSVALIVHRLSSLLCAPAGMQAHVSISHFCSRIIFFLLPCCMRELIMSRRKYKSLLASRPRYCKSREVRVTVIRLWMFFCRSK